MPTLMLKKLAKNINEENYKKVNLLKLGRRNVKIRIIKEKINLVMVKFCTKVWELQN